jgi:hypothetical protein
MKHVLFVASLAIGAVGWAGCSSSSGTSGLCPDFQTVPSCPIAPDAVSCSARTDVCGLDSLPTGIACTGAQQCSALIDPCPNWQRYAGGELTDGYICSCVSGVWSCDDCNQGEGTCAEAGAPTTPNDASVDGSGAVDAMGTVDAKGPVDGGGPVDATMTQCPQFGTVPSCPIAPDAASCGARTLTCGLDSLPTGAACTGSQQCSAVIDPCPNWQQHVGSELTDGYVCSCVNGVWSCNDCDPGAGLCAASEGGVLDAGGPG